MGKYIDATTDDDDFVDLILNKSRPQPLKPRQPMRKSHDSSSTPTAPDPRHVRKYLLNDDGTAVSDEQIDKKGKYVDATKPRVEDEKPVMVSDEALSDMEYMQRCVVFEKSIDPTTTLGYARVSSKRQILENQIYIFRQLGINVIFADKMSGTKYRAMERPDFRRMIEFVDNNPQYNTLLVYEISRLGRNMLDSITTFSELEGRRNIRVYSLTEPWTHSIDDDNRPLMISIFSWMNEMEAKRISRRTKAGQLRAKLEGKTLGKPIAIANEKRSLINELRQRGWTWDEIAHHREINCDESTIRRTRERWRRQDLGRE
jgi:putative DNA-invertase from lambdoid prophage Rac